MIRNLTAMGPTALVLVVAAMEPVMTTETDLFRYAVTQGGLLAIVLVLLWFYRRDFLSMKARDDETIATLVSLVKENTAETVKSAAASERVVRMLEILAARHA